MRSGRRRGSAPAPCPPRRKARRGRATALGGRSGSVAVFVCLFFVGMTVLLLTLMQVSRKLAVDSAVEALCNLWGQSVLAEYDQNLQQRYQIFGFYGCPREVEQKLDYYARQSLDGKTYAAYDGSRVRLYDYALVDVDLFLEQVTEAGKLTLAESFLGPARQVRRAGGTAGAGGDAAGTAGTGTSGETDGSAAGHPEYFRDLPSAGSTRSLSTDSVVAAMQDLSSFGAVVRAGSEDYLTDRYIFAYFKDAADSHGLGETWLRQEIEYLICGKTSDAANARSLRAKIIAVREPLNLLYLQREPTLRAAAAAAAQVLTPGPAAVVTEQAILAAWALAESVNDYRLLCSGHSVATLKTAQTWAVDLDAVLADRTEGCIFTGVETGEDYESYLRLFIALMDRRVRALRMMDLIQINMRHLYYDSFLLETYNGGVAFTVQVNGVDHAVAQKY